jgi:hypothetical protein
MGREGKYIFLFYILFFLALIEGQNSPEGADYDGAVEGYKRRKAATT